MTRITWGDDIHTTDAFTGQVLPLGALLMINDCCQLSFTPETLEALYADGSVEAGDCPICRHNPTWTTWLAGVPFRPQVILSLGAASYWARLYAPTALL